MLEREAEEEEETAITGGHELTENLQLYGSLFGNNIHKILFWA